MPEPLRISNWGSNPRINILALFNEPLGISNRGSNPHFNSLALFNEPLGIRTPDNLIKSQVLYHLS